MASRSNVRKDRCGKSSIFDEENEELKKSFNGIAIRTERIDLFVSFEYARHTKYATIESDEDQRRSDFFFF